MKSFPDFSGREIRIEICPQCSLSDVLLFSGISALRTHDWLKMSLTSILRTFQIGPILFERTSRLEFQTASFILQDESFLLIKGHSLSRKILSPNASSTCAKMLIFFYDCARRFSVVPFSILVLSTVGKTKRRLSNKQSDLEDNPSRLSWLVLSRNALRLVGTRSLVSQILDIPRP